MSELPTSFAYQGSLPDHFDIAWDSVEPLAVEGRMRIARKHMAPNGYLHAASVIALADSASGVGCMRSLPDGASSFTTIELKSNFLGTAGEGEVICCKAWLAHGGRTTQIWDAEVRNETSGRKIALFRCTQLLLYPKS
jgi:1,4-dihydroxy-2-naphthoyl-CoA hydrolase